MLLGMSDLHGVPATGIIWRLSMKWRSAVDRVLSALGLTHAQYAVLAPLSGMLARGQQPSQRMLADGTGLEPLYVSKLVRALERAGYVQRTHDPADARAVRLGLTPLGQRVTTEAIALVVGMQDELTAPLGGAQSPRTCDFLAAACALLGVDPAAGSAHRPDVAAIVQDIVRAGQSLDAALERAIAAAGTDRGTWRILDFLAGTDAAAPFEDVVARLAAENGIPAKQALSMLQALVSRGLLAAQDGHVGLAPGGRLLHRRVSEGLVRLAGGLVDDVADTELLIARRVLGHIAERAHDHGLI